MTIEQFKTDEVILSNINQDTIPKQIVMQGEKDGRSLTVQVRNGGVVEPQAGLNLNLGWKHRTAKDKNGELIQGLDAFQAIDRTTGLFRIEYASSMAQPGTIDAEIQFVTSTSVTKSQPFIITVKPSTVDENAVESESSFTVLQEALTHVSQYDEKIEGLELNKAEKDDLKQTQKSVSSITENKVDKNGVGQVNWGMLAQDAREQISGGKTAVVGKDGVTTENIVDGAVTVDKMVSTGKTGIVSFSNTNLYVNFDYENKKVTIPRGTRIYYDDSLFDFSTDETNLSFSDESAVNILVFDKNDKSLKVTTGGKINATSYILSMFGTKTLERSIFYCSGKYKIDNLDDMSTQKDMDRGAYFCYFGKDNHDFFNIDFGQRLVTFPASSQISTLNRVFNFNEETVLEIPDLSASKIYKFYVGFNIKTNKIEVVNQAAVTPYFYPIALFNTSNGVVHYSNGKYRINGKDDLGNEVSARLSDTYIAKNFLTTKFSKSDLASVNFNNKLDTEIMTGGRMKIKAGGYCFPRFLFGQFDLKKMNFILSDVSDPDKVSISIKTSNGTSLWGPFQPTIFNENCITYDVSTIPTENIELAATSYFELRIDNRNSSMPIEVGQLLVAKDGIPIGEEILPNTPTEVWVDGSVSENGDGTVGRPYQTIQAGLNSGAAIVNIQSGYYKESLVATDRDTLELRCIPESNFSVEKPVRAGVVIDNSEELSLSNEGAIYSVPYVAESSTNLYKVFISKQLTPIDPSSSRSIGYFATIWEDTGDYSKDKRLVPVLSLSECESDQGTFFYDGEKIFINPFDGIITGKDYRLIHKGSYAAQFERIRNLKMNDIVMKYSLSETLFCRQINDFLFLNCEIWRSALGNGFSLDNCNGTLKKCLAVNNRNDGFNFHKFGDTHLLDCEGHYNFDDGNSHHDGCTGSIIGGEWSYNGKGGCSPTYGAQIDIYNTYCHHNRYGMYVISSEDRVWRTVRHGNNVSVKNDWQDYSISRTTIIDIQNIYGSVDAKDGLENNMITFNK